MNAERYIKVLEHMTYASICLFQGKPCVFQHHNVKPHTAAITTAWLRSNERFDYFSNFHEYKS